MPTEFAGKVQVVGPDGEGMVVNADGTINSGSSGPGGSGTEFAKKVQVVGPDGVALVVNADGTINGVSV